MKVSVIMPMRDAAAYVAAAARSVLAQPVELELVVVDDGSTDGSRAVLEGLDDSRVRVIEGPCRGIAAAFNAGVEAASGRFVARCDADDLYEPGRLAWQVEWLETHATYGAVCGAFATMTARGGKVSDLNCGDLAEDIDEELKQGVVRTSLCTYLIRADVLRGLGGCRTFFETAEDIDLQLRFGERCPVWYEPRVCYHYRLHGSSMTHTQVDARRRFFDETARIFQKQRLKRGQDELDEGKLTVMPPSVMGRRGSARAQMASMMMGDAWRRHAKGDAGGAIRIGIKACWMEPLRWRRWWSLGVLVVRSMKVGRRGRLIEGHEA